MSPATTAAAGLIVALVAFPASAQPSEKPIYLEDFNCWGATFPLKIDQSGAGVRKLGKLMDERAPKDSYREFVFDGLAVTIYRKDAPLVSRVVVTKAGWNVIDGVKVGDPIQSVAQKVGHGAKAGPRLEVCGDTDCARFQAVDGRISRIEYTCYTG